MRLKQLFGNLLLLLVLSTMAAAGSTQLTDVAVLSKDNATTLTIRANGAFTHTEYRPTDNLLLVDLAGVSAAKHENHTRELRGTHPGVESYRVVGYKGANGVDITRVELTLAPSAVISVMEGKNSVAVKIASSAAPAVKAVSAEVPAKVVVNADAKNEAKAAASRIAQIKNVSVARGKNGLQVNISANSPIEPKALKLSSPDRIVIDVPNAVPASRNREFAVNSPDVKSIRISRYSLNPPATRIVVDLAGAREFQLSTNGTHATLQLQAVEAPVVAKATVPAPVMAAKAAEAVTVVEPKYTSRPTTQADLDRQKADEEPATRAAEAASRFAAPKYDIPVTDGNASMKMQPAINMAAMQQRAAATTQPVMASTTGCNRNRYDGEPISVNLKDVDLRDFFRLIHEISGLNVVLDPNVKGSLTIVLDDVPWDQALHIVLKNNGLDCQLEGNVLRIATNKTIKAEADDRRAQIEAQALAVELITINRYLSYAAAKDIVPTLKTFLSARGSVIADERTNSLIISDIPGTMPNVDRLIRELDRKTQEVEIEARVVAASRSFARDIGTQLGFGFANSTTFVGGGQGGTSPLVCTGSACFNGGTIPLFSNLRAGGTTNSGIAISTEAAGYRLDFILTAGENRGLLKILSRPRVVTQNNYLAVVKQGTRIPVITGAQLGGPPTVTYIDAFLRLTVRPQITAEGTIFLNIDVENTVPDFSRVTADNQNPLLLTQQATTQVLVTDGGTVVIGGVIQTQNNVAINQVPLLGNIPVFGNLFKRRNVSTSTQELIFFITPKIIQT